MSIGMSEFSERLKERAMAFAVAVLRLVDRLPPTPAGRVIAFQLAKSATSVAANDRAACNARSRQEFIAKLGNCATSSPNHSEPRVPIFVPDRTIPNQITR
jgi:hypothetical protein